LQALFPDALAEYLRIRIEPTAILIGVAIELPLCLFGTFKSLSLFSSAGVVSTCAVMALVIGLPVLDPAKECVEVDSDHHWLNPEIMPATAIFAVIPSCR
jgi:hypothetical protein